MKNYYSGSLALGFLLLIGLACGSPSNNSTTTPPANTSNANTPATTSSSPAKPQESAPVADLKWSDYDKIYNVKSDSTDMQKEAAWKNFEGKTVTWSGTVGDVSEGMISGLVLQIKMNPDTLTHDIRLSLKSDQKDKMMTLKKGQKVTFTGRLKTAGGTVLPLSMDEGELK